MWRSADESCRACATNAATTHTQQLSPGLGSATPANGSLVRCALRTCAYDRAARLDKPSHSLRSATLSLWTGQQHPGHRSTWQKALQQACASLRPCRGCLAANSQQPALTGSEGHLSSWEELALRAGSTQSLTGLISPSAACKGLRQQRKIRQAQLDHNLTHGLDPDLR